MNLAQFEAWYTCSNLVSERAKGQTNMLARQRLCPRFPFFSMTLTFILFQN